MGLLDIENKMENVSYVNWNEFHEIDNLRTKRFAKKVMAAVAIIWLLMVLQICTDILNPYIRFIVQSILFLWISHAYLSDVVWRRKYIARLYEWDNAIKDKKFEDVINGSIKSKVETPGLMTEIMKIRKSENKEASHFKGE